MWRAFSLLLLTVLMIAHYIQWRATGSTVSPIEPSEAMYTLSSGAVNAGFIFFILAILATVLLGRWVCGWGCHVVALQDLCSWILRKCGLRPKPFRSRLLMYVPLLAAAYMFLWPVALRIFARPAGEALIPEFTNHLITTDFWATFPTVAVAVPFLFICGFVTVYFLGNKGFCTYGCPYGGVFVLADRVSPARIRVTDACNQCGQCSVNCTANVDVAGEVAKYGMVVDPGCMKHLDCISVCPKDALYFGFGKPSIAVKKAPVVQHQLSWSEELLAAAVFFASFFAAWDVYLLVPMLMALGIAIVTTFLVIKAVRILTAQDVSFHKWTLKEQGRIVFAGWLFLAFALTWTVFNAHSGFVRYHEFLGVRAYQQVQVPDELALAQPDPGPWLTEADRKNLQNARTHMYKAFDAGVFVNTFNLQSLAWTEYLSGNTDQAAKLLGLAADRQEGQSKALSLYYRGSVLNRLGRFEEALPDLDNALRERPDLIKAVEEKGVSLWKLGRRDEAAVGSSRVDLQACKLEYSIVSPK